MKIAMYIRLSDADEDTGFSKAESESVVNQRKYINNFLNEHKTLSDFERLEFVDDGFSGINADRPKLTKMMEATRKGNIDVICVKDFSRFFRDYIEAGNYLECVFPFLGTRFISINDNYDSDDYKGTTGGMEMVLRNIIYAAYSKDLSLKVVTSKVSLMKQGKFIGSHAPFGYSKDPFDKNKLIIDEKSSKIVRRIFDLAMVGKTSSEIACILNDEKIPTKGQYFKENNPNNKKFGSMLNDVAWNVGRVQTILKNRLYIGDLVCHRRKKVSYNSKKVITQEPIITENTHEGIVSRDEFYKAMEVINVTKQGKKINYQQYALKGVLRCGNCKYMLQRHKRSKGYVYKCANCNLNVSEKHIETKVFNVIKQFIQLENTEVKNDVLDEKYFDTEIERNKQSKLRLYEKYVAGDILKEHYLKQKISLDEIISELQKKQLNHQSKEPTKNVCTKFASAEILTEEMVKSFIDVVYVFDENKIEIIMKCADLF